MTSKDVFNYGVQSVVDSVNELAADVERSDFIREDNKKLEVWGIALIQLAQKIGEMGII